MHGRTGGPFSRLLASRSPVPRDFYRYARKVASTIETRDAGRRFRIADAFILTASIAIALVVCQLIGKFSYEEPTKLAFYICTFGYALTWTAALYVAFGPTSVTSAARSPGGLAVLLVTAVSLVTVLLNWHSLFWFAGTWPQYLDYLLIDTILQPIIPGLATLAGWLTLALTNTKSSTTDWIEYFGRVLGGLWIAFAFLSPFLTNQILRSSIGVTM